MNSERMTINLVVCFLGLVVLFGMAIGGYLAIDDKGVPDFIVATTSGAIGALGAMLAKTSSWTEPQNVTVSNPTSDPIPTTDVKPKPKK